MKRNKAAEAALQAVLAGIETARDAGRDYFKEAPDEMLVTVARWAAIAYDDKHLQIAFLQGYGEARIKHDAWQEGE
jgi:hypothetical protein